MLFVLRQAKVFEESARKVNKDAQNLMIHINKEFKGDNEHDLRRVSQESKKGGWKIDKGAVKEHAAIEIDIEGEGEGAFYVELDKDKVAVEPYEYYDNDCRIRTGAETLIDLVTGKIDAVKALEDGKISVDGDIEKALVLSDVLKATVNKKSSEAKKPATASKSATSKKTTNKKASSK